MHQPDYREPGSNRLAMPWVRLHALKDYLDMPLHAAARPAVRTTFNLVPSLLDQLELYLNGGTDRHLELTQRPSEELTDSEKREILESFFSAHTVRMIDPYPRYRELLQKYKASSSSDDVVPALFTSTEMRDLQVWSNLTWVDPMFRTEEPIGSLFAKGRHFTEEEKHALVRWQMKLIARIVPTYKKLLAEGNIDISFTPYYHPILPLLCDTDSAREALPGIHLPEQRFQHPEDAERQVAMSVNRFLEVFDRPLTGMWPSEGSVSEQTLEVMAKSGIQWAASDEEILYQSLAKSGLDRTNHPLHAIYEHNGVRLFFRDHALSDRIGFVYSGWPARQAVADFAGHLHRLRDLLKDSLDTVVVPVILDGENAWEYFPDDADEFLRELYRVLDEDPLLETVTMSDAAREISAHPLRSLFAGSWINHNFRIWIGHSEDNAAWDLLSRARNALAEFERENPSFDAAKLKSAWNQIYVAEGSDWCWWYGDEHRGQHNAQFDQIFRRHLSAVYELIGHDVPLELLKPIHGAGAESFTVMPDDILTAQIDGRLTHFYEWAGAGYFDCLKAGGAMHRVDRYLTAIHFAFDHNRFYIRLDFHDRKAIELLKDPVFEVACFTPSPHVIRIRPETDGFAGEKAGEQQWALGAIFELALERDALWPEGFGPLGFTVTLLEGSHSLESWPEGDPIQIDVPEKNAEIFWPS